LVQAALPTKNTSKVRIAVNARYQRHHTLLLENGSPQTCTRAIYRPCLSDGWLRSYLKVWISATSKSALFRDGGWRTGFAFVATRLKGRGSTRILPPGLLVENKKEE